MLSAKKHTILVGMIRINSIYVAIKKCIKHQKYLTEREINFIFNANKRNELRKLTYKEIQMIFALQHKINRCLLIERVSKKKSF